MPTGTIFGLRKMTDKIEIADVHGFIMDNLEGVVPQEAYGETAYFYNPGMVLKRGTYFATIKEKDGENDSASQLDREGVWRLSMGVRKKTFLRMYDKKLDRPDKGQVIRGGWHFAGQDNIMPHPVYGWMNWLIVLNPSAETFERCKPLILEAHRRAVDGFNKRTKGNVSEAESEGE